MSVKYKGANLSGINLRGVDLSYEDLRFINLNGADLTGADLSGAIVLGANLIGANFRRANLRDAIFTGSNFKDANLRGADIRGAWFVATRNLPELPLVCPEIGAFIGYSKVSGYIVELEVLPDSKRLSATSGLCRCDKARILRVLDHKWHPIDICSVNGNEVGDLVIVDDFDDNRWNERGRGIHFFTTFQEALRDDGLVFVKSKSR